MANKLYEENNVRAVADAIRTKGVSGTMKLADMPSKIASINAKESVTWNQCPTAVKNFLDNVTYDTDYTYTHVTEYAPTPAVSSNTKPIGKTVDGVTYYNDVPNVDTPFSSTNTAGTLKPLDRLRWINSRTANMRDLGGWSCDGGTIKYGLIYRSGALNAQDENLVINELGIRQEIDLRGSDEATESVYGNKIRYLSFNGADVMYTLAPKDTWRAYLRALFDSVIVGDPVVFHCASGADRTGSFACIIEALLGVSQSDCDKDYELTSFYLPRHRNEDHQGGGGADWRRLISQITALSGNTFRDKVVNFVASLGFTAAEINSFRAAMIDGTPETVTPSIATYTITKSGSNVTFSNSASAVDQYQSYECEITPASGYVIDSVTVTMGGTDVTPSSFKGDFVNSGTIQITSNGTVNVDGYNNAEVNVPTGITPTGTKSITANGTYDVTNFASASVNVPSAEQSAWTTTVTLSARVKSGVVVELPSNVLAHKNDDNFSIEIRPATAWTGTTYRSYYVAAGNRLCGNNSYGLYCYITSTTNNQSMQILDPVKSSDTTIATGSKGKLAIINGNLCLYENAGAGLEANFAYKVTASW